jgi:glutathione synthase/RimK-type ligase-like ATP-grasp enzyme
MTPIDGIRAPSAPSLSIAFATYAADPEIQADDKALVDALMRHGAVAVARVWDDPEVDWTAFDAIVLRSTWDYFVKAERFRDWLEGRECEGTRIINPVAAVRWNIDKRYLRDLEARGVPIVPTHWVNHGERADLPTIIWDRGWNEVVVKPAISGAAYETWRTTRERAADGNAKIHALAASGAVLVQPFLPEIERDGDWSLLFFAGRFSHAARKRPRSGDFRVQSQFGGNYSAETAPKPAIDAARRVIAATLELTGLTRRELSYARVDGCIVDGRFLLMELEVIEPALFFAQSPAAPELCASSILDALAPGAADTSHPSHGHR